MQPWNWLHLVRGILKLCSCYPTTRDVPSLPLKIHSLLLQANNPPPASPSLLPSGDSHATNFTGLGTALNPSSLLLPSCGVSRWQQELSARQCISITPCSVSPGGKSESSQHRVTVCGTMLARNPLRRDLGELHF